MTQNTITVSEKNAFLDKCSHPTDLDVQLYRAADALEGNVVGENEFVSKTVNHLPVQYLSEVGSC